MTRKSILVLTGSHLCRNPRVVKEATTLGEAGYDVTVMSVSVQERFERMDLALIQGLPFRRQVLDYRGTTARTRLAGFFQRGATWAARRLAHTCHIGTAQSLGPARALLRLAQRQTADLTIGHTEIPLWAAERLLRDGRRVAVDLEDWYSEDLLPADRRTRPLQLLRTAERYALNHAAYASTTSESMAAALAMAYQCRKPVVLRNTFPLPSASRLDHPAVAVPRFVWFSQTIGPGRGLEPFLSAWSKMRHPSQVHLIGDVRAEYQQHLLTQLSEARRSDVHFIPLLPPGELAAKLSSFDIGLALEPREPRNKDLTISNKLFQYLNAGLAIIATDTAGQSEVMRAAPGCGLLIGADQSTFTGQLDALVGDRRRLQACQRAARTAAASEFNWSHDSARLLRAVQDALASPIGRSEHGAPPGLT
jgi:glycosyltransferase involved in cell wall biosynthesis